MTRIRARLLAGGLGIALLTSGAIAVAHGGDARRATAQPRQRTAVAILYNVAGDPVGEAFFTTDGEKVRVQVEARGLPPGFHGFHIHTVGVCDPSGTMPFTSAGGHFVQTEMGRAYTGQDHAQHAGDMPSLYITADGTGSLALVTDRFAVADLLDADGSALMIHAGPDNFANIPTRYAPMPDMETLATGDSGGRIACAVVESTK